MNDLISREIALKVFEDYIGLTNKSEDARHKIISILKSLPSAESERKNGEWIEYPDCLRYEGAYADDQIVCSACHHVFSILDNCTEEFDFCPNCGADMRGEE